MYLDIKHLVHIVCFVEWVYGLSHWKIYYYSMEINFFFHEHKVMTWKQQFLAMILCFFHVFKMATAIAFLYKKAVEAI